MLGRLHTPAARDWLLAASRNDHHKVRWNALIGLGELGDRSVYPRLEEAARTDVDHSVRLAAISAMGGVKAPESYELLVALLGEQDAGLRISAAWSLGELGDARAVPALQRAADDQQERVRVEAASALRKLGSAPAPAEPAHIDPAGAPLSRLAGQPLNPDNPPLKDPRDLDVLTWQTPATRGERVVDYCPACRMRTVQDRFTVIVSHWYGLKVPLHAAANRGQARHARRVQLVRRVLLADPARRQCAPFRRPLQPAVPARPGLARRGHGVAPAIRRGRRRVDRARPAGRCAGRLVH